MKQCPVCNTDYPDENQTCPTDGALLLSPSGPEWAAGTLIRGKYRILACLGKGGMGVVYKAQHVFLDELRALKVMWPHLAADAKFRQRFLREGKEGRKLRNNAHIVAIEDQEQAEDGSLYIAMEYVAGVSLRDLLRHVHGPLPIPRALNIARGMAEGLQTAHALGMVHRDIKPDNVLLARDSRGWDVPKIADFGIVALREYSTALSSHPLLTAPYAAPEQWKSDPGTQADGRTDLYALGITLFEMLTGRLPFRAETPTQWLHAHLTQQPAPPSRFALELAEFPSVDRLVLKLLSKKMEERPQDAQAFLRELDLVDREIAMRQFSYNSAPREGPTETATPPPPPVAPPRARRPRAAGAKAGAAKPVSPFPPVPRTPQEPEAASPPPAGEPGRAAPAPAPQLLPPQPPRSGRMLVFGSVFACLAAVLVVLFMTVWKPLWAPHAQNSDEQQQRAEIARHLKAAEEAFARGAYDAAIGEFTLAQSLDPGNASARDGIDKAQRAKATEGAVLPEEKPSQ